MSRTLAPAAMTSATSGAQPPRVTSARASLDTSLSGRYGENTRSTQCSHRTAAASDPSCRADRGTSKETTVPMTCSACRARAVRAEGSTFAWLTEDDAFPGDPDRLGGQRAGRGAADDGPILDAELAAMARTVDRAVADLVDDAPHVRADGTERLEVTGDRLRDDDLLGGQG